MTTSSPPGARVVELLAFDCWQLLESGEIARVAWNASRGLAVVPVNYVVADGALWFRTEPYGELARGGSGQPVVVEVDSLDPVTRSGWSVLVRGLVELVDTELAPARLAELRVWPTGSRSTFLRVRPDEITGRRLLAPATHLED